MDFAGINRKITPIGGPMGISYYQQNTRMRVDKEIQRRLGMCSTNLPKANAAIIGLAAAYTPNGPIVASLTPTDVIGAADPLPMWREMYLRGPRGDPVTCTIWAPHSDSGTSGTSNGFALAAGGCPGTVTFSCAEAGGGGSGGGGTDYGYSILVNADGVPILTSGCLVNSGAFAAIPANTLLLSYTVTAGCAGGSTLGSWSLNFTCP
jgi:hypothetical protein